MLRTCAELTHAALINNKTAVGGDIQNSLHTQSLSDEHLIGNKSLNHSNFINSLD